MSRSALGMIEVVVVAALGAILIVPLLSLSAFNVDDHQVMLERSVAQGLCLDMMDRFKRYKPFWPMPGSPVRPPSKKPGPPISQMYGPVELSPDRTTLFDKAYLELLASLRMSPRPTIERVADPRVPGLFVLTVGVAWKDHRGRDQRLSYSRCCYAP